MNYFKIFLLSFALLFVSGFALAQDVTEEVDLDEEVGAADLQIEEPRILPDSPVYFLKNWGREIQSFFAFDAVKKAELKLKFASEKLIEARKLAEIKKDSGIIKRGLDGYQTEIEKIKEAADKIKENAQDNPKVNSFLDKFTHQQLLHYKILQKLETQVPPEVLTKIRETRERHLERFGEVMNRLEANSEKIKERLEKQMEEIKGSEFKNFKNLEILKELEEKVPVEAKGAIRETRENILMKLKEKVGEMTTEKIEQFQTYTEKISGVKEKQVEILENLKEKLGEKPKIQERLLESQIKILEKIRTK